MTPMKSPIDNHDGGPAITTKELKQLRRVYEELCSFSEKYPKKERLKEIEYQLTELRRPGNVYTNHTKRKPSHQIMIDGDNDDNDGDGETSADHEGHDNEDDDDDSSDDEHTSIETLEREKQRLLEDIHKIESKPEQYIRPQDTGIAMKSLGKYMSKRDINVLMWEVDEKIDGVIDWEEFSLMFERNVRDTSGLEPANFYHMVQFMIYDRDGNGKVSIDETMNMLYARLGRAKMETTISKLFGGEDGAPIVEVGQQGGEIDFERYWDVSENEQMKTFEASELGRNLAEKRKVKR